MKCVKWVFVTGHNRGAGSALVLLWSVPVVSAAAQFASAARHKNYNSDQINCVSRKTLRTFTFCDVLAALRSGILIAYLSSAECLLHKGMQSPSKHGRPSCTLMVLEGSKCFVCSDSDCGRICVCKVGMSTQSASKDKPLKKLRTKMLWPTLALALHLSSRFVLSLCDYNGALLYPPPACHGCCPDGTEQKV